MMGQAIGWSFTPAGMKGLSRRSRARSAGLPWEPLWFFLIGPPVTRIRNNAVFVLVQLLLIAAGAVLFLFWVVVLIFALVGAGMGAMDPVTARDGQRVLLDRSVRDQDIMSVWVPHSVAM